MVKVLFLILFLFLGALCFSQTISNGTGGGDWNVGASWVGGVVPPTGADVIIATGDVITISGPITNDDINSLALQGTGNLDFTGSETLIVATSITMSGTSSITGTANTHRIDAATFNIPSGTASIGGIRLTISGLTTVTGTLSFTSTTGNKTFGDVTVTGTWDNSIVTEVFTFTGNLVNNGTWNGCFDTIGCAYTMTSATATLSGASTFNVTDFLVNAPATVTNNGSVVMTDNITGTGSFINGATGTLTLSDNGTYSITTLTLNTVGNSVIYAGSVNEVINIGPFYNLEINMAANTNVCQMNGSDVAVNNNLVITQGILRLASANTLAVTGNLTITTNGEFEPNNAGAIANIGGDIIMTGGLYDHNNGDINITDDFQISGGTFTYTGTSTLDFDQMTVENTSIVLSGGTIASTNAVGDGITLNAGGILDIRAATVNVTNNINIANATAELTPNDVGAVLNVGGDLLMSDGNYDHNNGDVNITDDFLISGGTFTYTGTSTLDFDQMTVENTSIVLSGGTITSTNAVGDGITLNTGGILDIRAATVNVTNNLNIANATAELTPNNVGAVLNVGGDLLMSDGNYDHNNGDVNITDDFLISGGVLNITGASTVDMDQMTITNSTSTLAGGTVTITNIADGITFNAAGVLIHNAATLNLTGNLNIANATAEYSPNNVGTVANIGGNLLLSAGEYDHNNGDVNVTGDILVSGTGLINFAGAASTLDATDFTMTNGTANLTAGTWTISNATGGMNINGGLVNVNGAHTLNVTNQLSIGGGEFQPSNLDMVANIGGNLTMTSGTFDQNDGDINISGDLLISGGTMTMNEGATPGESTIDATDMSVTAPANISLVEGTLTLSNAAGGLTVNSGDFAVTNAAHTLAIAGNYNINGGASDINAGTVSFVNMAINTGGTINVASPVITSTGLINVINGTFTVDGAAGTYNFNSLTVGAAGTWNVTAAYSPTFSGNLVNNGTFTGCNGVGCVYNLTNNPGSISGSGAMNAMAGLSITNSYTNTNSGGLQITQSLAGNTFINGTNGAMSYSGTNANWTLTNFTANGAGNTVTYDRTVSNQLLQPTTDNTYHNLVINKADGQDMTTSSEITINNQLTLTAGDIIMGGQNLIIAAAATIVGGGSTSYIQDTGAGVLRKMTTATGSFTAPIGGTAFSPITINLTSATIGGGASLDFSITDTAHPQRDRDNTGDAPPGDDNGTGKPAAVDFLDVFWTVAGNSITNPVYNATYVYDASDFTQTTESNMVGILYRAITGGTLDWLPTGTVNATNNTVTFAGATAFGDFYAMDDTNERLPIVLLSFKAKPNLEAVELEWVTGGEVNNQFFTIERSGNGLDFEPVLFVEGAGNSTELLTYTVVDDAPLLGRSYYRLKQTDFNGQFEYSEIVSVIFEGSSTFDFGMMSNPINQGEMVVIWKTTSLEGLNPTLSLRDIRGQLITQTSLSSLKHNDYQIPNSNRLSSGIYLLSINYLGETKTRKIIIK
uniref:T9SS type A sorting domain-containing protein n=1 Tax=Roseivirga sp. TaxID=1964215 RepID=UPI004048E36E